MYESPSDHDPRPVLVELGLFEITCDRYLVSTRANFERTPIVFSAYIVARHRRLPPSVSVSRSGHVQRSELPGSFTSVSLLGTTVQAGSSRLQFTPAFTIRHLGLSSSTIFFCTLKSSSSRIFEIASHRISKDMFYVPYLFTLHTLKASPFVRHPVHRIARHTSS